MRFTRAAKVAAFPLTALILVALVACQGPAGPAGGAGAKGDQGAAGTPGTPGTPGGAGVDAFQDRVDVANVLLNPDELMDADDRIIDNVADMGGDATTKAFVLNLANYFIGGVPDYSYEIVDAVPDAAADSTTLGAQFVTANDLRANLSAEVKGGNLEYKITKTDATFADAAYVTGFSGMVTATDGNDVTATVTITIMLNKEPSTIGLGDDGLANSSTALCARYHGR